MEAIRATEINGQESKSHFSTEFDAIFNELSLLDEEATTEIQSKDTLQIFCQFFG